MNLSTIKNHLVFSLLAIQLVGCGGETSSSNSPNLAGVSTGGTGGSIAPGVGGGDGENNSNLDNNATTGVNSNDQPPLLPLELALTAQPMRIVQSYENAKFYTMQEPPVLKATLSTKFKPEGILATTDGAVIWLSTASQTGYQFIAFDGVGTPISSKIYALDGKVMFASSQTINSSSYYLDMLVYNVKNALSINQHLRYKVVDGELTKQTKTVDLTYTILQAASNNKQIVWVGQDQQQQQWLNMIDCSANQIECQYATPVPLTGKLVNDTSTPRSSQKQLQILEDKVTVYTSSPQKLVTTFSIQGLTLVAANQQVLP